MASDQGILDKYSKDNDLVSLPIDYSIVECPVCGATEDQQCSIPDPDREGFGIDLSSLVHRKRLEE